MQSIKENSRIVRIFAQWGCYVTVPAMILIIYMVITAPAGTNIKIAYIDIPTSSLLNVDKVAVIIIVVLMSGVYLMALIYLKKLFALYEQGIIFEDKNAKYMNNFAYSIILYSIVNSFSGLALPNHKIFQPDFGTFIIGVIFLVISMVINEGRKIKQESDLTV